MGYSPNPAAKALRLQRTHIVGAVFPTTDHGLYARMVEHFQRRMSEAGYLTFLRTAGFDSRNMYDAVQPLVERGAEALMIVGRIDDPKLVAYLESKGIPVVCTYSSLKDNPFASIGIDNYEGTHGVMEYLRQLGHREFALLSGPLAGNDRQQARAQAYRDVIVKQIGRAHV